jgi:hypothetical protein
LSLSISDKQQNRTIEAKIPNNLKLEYCTTLTFYLIESDRKAQSPLLVPSWAAYYRPVSQAQYLAVNLRESDPGRPHCSGIQRKLKPVCVSPIIEKGKFNSKTTEYEREVTQ